MKNLIAALNAKIKATPGHIKKMSSLTGVTPSHREKLPFVLGVKVLKYDTLVVLLYAAKAYALLGPGYKTQIAKALDLETDSLPSYLERVGALRGTLFSIIDKCGFNPTEKEMDNLIEFAVRNVFVLAPRTRRPYFLGYSKKCKLSWDYTQVSYSAGEMLGYAMYIKKHKEALERLGFERPGVGYCSGSTQPDLI